MPAVTERLDALESRVEALERSNVGILLETIEQQNAEILRLISLVRETGDRLQGLQRQFGIHRNLGKDASHAS